MFKRINSYIRNVRINFNFPQYERQCRRAHKELAESRFSTKTLDVERNSLLFKIKSQAISKFDDLIKIKKIEKSQTQSLIDDKEIILLYFTRCYRQEIDRLYEEKNILSVKKTGLYERKNKLLGLLSDAFYEKDNAYSDLNCHKYRKYHENSSYRYHKSGRNLACDNIQKAKNNIGDIKYDIENLNSNIAEIKTEINILFDKINQAKKDRTEMYKMKDSGHGKKKIQIELEYTYKALNQITIKLKNLALEKREYITSKKHEYGITALESKIKKIKFNENQFISSFDIEENKQKRKNEHRELWLNNN